MAGRRNAEDSPSRTRRRWYRYPAVTPALELARFELETRRRRWRSSAGRVDGKRLCACEIRCDLCVTYKLGKWSGRLDSNQRPPAPKCTVVRCLATLCNQNNRKPLIRGHFRAQGCLASRGNRADPGGQQVLRYISGRLKEHAWKANSSSDTKLLGGAPTHMRSAS
jgi:hypothetical protein